MKYREMLSAPMVALMVLSFFVGGCEYVGVAILPDIAGGIGATLEQGGKLVSAFAVGYAVGTPIITSVTTRYPRFRVMITLVCLFLAANLLTALAPNLGVMYVARTLTAVVSGSVTATVMLFVREIVPPDRTALGLSWVYTSMALAAVIGNPLAKVACRVWSWRAVFWVVLAAVALLLPVLVRVLPRPAVAVEARKTGLVRQLVVLRDSRYLLSVATTVCAYISVHMVYTYLTPILTDVLGAGDALVSVLLMLVGIFCLGSDLLAGWLGQRGGVKKLPWCFLAQTVLFALMPMLLRGFLPGVAAILVMALLMYVTSTPIQDFAMGLAEREYPFATGLCASTMAVSGNIGIALGSFVGSSLQETIGLRVLGYPAAVMALAALLVNLALLQVCRKRQQVSSV